MKKKKREQKVVRNPTLAEFCAELGADPPNRLGLRTFRDGRAWEKHAGNIMHVMFLWTKIDVEMLRLLLPMMHGEHALVIRMLNATRNPEPAIVAVAKNRLDSAQLELFKKINGGIGRLRKRRGIYAHWVAAHAKKPTELVDRVLFIDPAHLASVHAGVHTDPDATLADEQFPEIDPRFVLVYDEPDITRDRLMSANALGALRLLRFHLLEPQDAEIHARLLERQRNLEILHFPEIQKA